MAMTEDEVVEVENGFSILDERIFELEKKVKRLTKKLKEVRLEAWTATHKCTSLAHLLLDLIGEKNFVIESGDPDDQSPFEWTFGSTESKDGGDPECYWDFAPASRESFDRAGGARLSLKAVTRLLASQPDPDGH